MKSLYIILFIIIAFNLNAQNYDLLVTTSGDSIACFIDSISDTHIYFEMKAKDRWTHTKTALNSLIEYKSDAINKKLVIFKSGTSYIKEIRTTVEYSDKNILTSRYIFAPSALGMKPNTCSYTCYDAFLHDFQFGISDKFSFGFGSTIFTIPYYIMPTYTYRINEKSAVAMGDLLMFSIYPKITFFGNLLYVLYTRGNIDNNFSVGVGLWTMTNSDIASETISPAFNLSASFKINNNVSFLTENYFVQMNSDYSVNYEMYDPVNDTIYRDHTGYNNYASIITGISGFRLNSKKHPRNSWQLSVLYIFRFNEYPEKYKQPGWDPMTDKFNYGILPIVSFSRKF